jgi:NADPH:quinone reductase-like Zn-dependent oxidoreductase
VRPNSFPARIGYEAAGEVIEVGEQVTDFSVGDRVGAFPCAFDPISQGGLAEEVTIHQSLALPTPREVTDRDAGAFWMAYLTAGGALMGEADLRAGDAVVITAASSSVGLAAIAIAKQLGATVIATTTHGSKTGELQKAGADHVIPVRDEDYRKRLKALGFAGNIRVFFDAVAGPMLNEHIKAAAYGARIVVYGLLDPSDWSPHIGLLIGKHIHVAGFNIAALPADLDNNGRLVRFIHDGIASQRLPLHVDKYWSLAEVADAHRYMEGNSHCGKIVIVP